MSQYQCAGELLKKWAVQVRNANIEVISDITKEATIELANCFNLPEGFTSYLDDYEKREGALQSIADYRDHFIHPFHVFCLGFCILRRWDKSTETKEIPRIPLFLIESIPSDDNNLRAWFAASILHDVGYPAEKLEALIHDFFESISGKELKSQLDWGPVLLAGNNISHINDLNTLFKKKSNSKISRQGYDFTKWFYKRLLDDHDHGVLSALLLLNQKWDESDRQIALEAALAIALHNYHWDQDIKDEPNLGPLAAEEFPLAFFLSYCDCAQEWGRKILLSLLNVVHRSKTDTDHILKDSLNNILSGPVPKLTKNKANGDYRIKTQITISYQAEDSDKIHKNHTLASIFKKVGHQFKSTWYLKNQKRHDYVIEGRDKNDHSLGDINPGSIKNPKKAKS